MEIYTLQAALLSYFLITILGTSMFTLFYLKGHSMIKDILGFFDFYVIPEEDTYNF